MPPLISCKSISKTYGSRELFQDITVSFFSGDCIGLIGPNGAGKSTLLNLIAKLESPDTGEIIYNKNVRIGYVPQKAPKYTGTVLEALEEALIETPHIEEFDREGHLRRILGKVGLQDPDQMASELSGGWARRLSIAKALVNEPNILLLDEPTNHLDLDTIIWLEGFLKRSFQTFIVTSHDRVFLDNISTKLWELSPRYPKGIFAVEGGYAEFTDAREIFLKGQKQYERGLRSKVVREEEWLKQTPQARSTKARARIQETARLQHELAKVRLRNKESKAELSFNASDRQTKKLLVGKNLSKSFETKEIFSKVDVRLMRGDRIAIVGDNGSGKSTLLKILAKEISSDTGTLKYADDLNVFYFDQHREQLDLNITLRRALSPNTDTIRYRNKNIHVNKWCEKFLFDKSRLDLPIKYFSGGERARILIARLMLRPVDVLLLDEPTNDLDIDTLDILEESLDDFPGSVVLISHDRALVDRVSDQLVFLEKGGGYSTFNDTSTWLKYRKQQARDQSQKSTPVEKKIAPKKKGLSYKEKQELLNMDKTISKLGKEVEALSKILEDPKMQDNAETLQKTCKELAQKEKEIEKAYERWQELEDQA